MAEISPKKTRFFRLFLSGFLRFLRFLDPDQGLVRHGVMGVFSALKITPGKPPEHLGRITLHTLPFSPAVTAICYRPENFLACNLLLPYSLLTDSSWSIGTHGSR
ncbi:hypothetical protein [Pseudomonas fluorescens]|uniref:hypothetical protein n=1 Tax=Pseudomonas fluorescens TaxID=294 RepID=UPI001240D9B1|nr:hypothetical protein [Pseudomonas fluorescens]